MSIDQEPVDSPQGWVAEHVRRYVETNGEDGYWWRGAPTLILTTLGRRSGKARRLALIYGEDNGRYIIVASKGGSDTHPEWYLNLRENPDVMVQVRDNRFRAKARAATPDEHKALWPRMEEIWPDYDKYQQKTNREIPLVILERV